MKLWSTTMNMSQELTGFDVFSTVQIAKHVNDERQKCVKDGEALSYKLAIEKKPLSPVDPWLIDMAFKKFEEKYKDIEEIELIDIEIKLARQW